MTRISPVLSNPAHFDPTAPIKAPTIQFGSVDTFTLTTSRGIPLEQIDSLIALLEKSMQGASTVEAKSHRSYEVFPRLIKLVGMHIPKGSDLKPLTDELNHQIENIITSFLVSHVLPMEKQGNVPDNFDETFREKLQSCRQMFVNFNALVSNGLHANTKTPGQIWKMVHDVLKPIAEEKGVNLNVRGMVQLLLQFRGFNECSNARFYSLMMNLVQNAIKYTPSNGAVEVDFNVASLPGTEIPSLEIRVRDEGIGIPAHEQKKVLRGERGSNAKASGIPGSGFGLSQINTIVRYAVGKLEINSPLYPEKANPGTEIACWLPLQQAH